MRGRRAKGSQAFEGLGAAPVGAFTRPTKDPVPCRHGGTNGARRTFAPSTYPIDFAVISSNVIDIYSQSFIDEPKEDRNVQHRPGWAATAAGDSFWRPVLKNSTSLWCGGGLFPDVVLATTSPRAGGSIWLVDTLRPGRPETFNVP